MEKTEFKGKTAKSCFGHLGGKAGGRLFERLLELGWFEATEEKSTVYKITQKGFEELAKLGVTLD